MFPTDYELLIGYFQALFQMLGAAFAISASQVPEWEQALSNSSGNLLEVILSRSGGFGKFCTVFYLCLAFPSEPGVHTWILLFRLSWHFP
jgi:hypothetical protein